MSSEADDTGGIFTRTRTRKRTRAVLDSARESDTRVVTFEDIPRDIKNEILGEAKLPDPVDRALVRVVSRSMRDAVDATGRDIEKLNTNTECRRAAELGWLSTLKNRLRRGILDKPSVCKSAAKFGHLEIVKWARENGCPWEEARCTGGEAGAGLSVPGPRINYLEKINRIKYTCAWAARRGHLEVLKWVRENGCPWDEKTCSWAAKGGHLATLKWARENGCPWDEETCANLAEGGHLETLKWAHENDCPWDDRTCANLAGGGHLEMLLWARENDCPWSEWTCACAAWGGHFEILKWARENGCPWDKQTCEHAAGAGRLEILKWARENGCPWDWHTRAWADFYVDVLDWLDAHGCPKYESDEDDEYYTSSSDVYSSDDSSDDELEEEESG